jgi:hypothetical protein
MRCSSGLSTAQVGHNNIDIDLLRASLAVKSHNLWNRGPLCWSVPALDTDQTSDSWCTSGSSSCLSGCASHCACQATAADKNGLPGAVERHAMRRSQAGHRHLPIR